MFTRLFWFILVFSVISIADAQRRNISKYLYSLDTATEDTIRVNYLRRLGYAYRNVNMDSSLMYGHQLVTLATRLDDSRYLSHGYNILGIDHGISANYDSAVYYFKRIQQIAQEEKYEPFASSAVTNLATAYGKMGRHDLAIKLLLEGMQVDAARGDNNRMRYKHLAMAENLILKRRYDDALSEVLKSVEITDQLVESGELRPIQYVRLCEIYNGLNEPETALNYANKGIKISQDMGDELDLMYLYTSASESHMLLNQLDTAYTYLKRSLVLGKHLPDLEAISKAHHKLGQVHSRLGNLDSSIYYNKKALDLASGINCPRLQSIAEYNLANSYYVMGDAEKAMEFAANSFDSSDEYGYYDYKSRASLLLSRLREQSGDIEEALRFRIEYSKAVDTLFVRENSLAIARAEEKFKNKAKMDSLGFVIAEQEKIAEIRSGLENQRIIGLAVIALLSLVVAGIFLNSSRVNAQKREELQELSEKLNAKNREIEEQHERLKTTQGQLIISEKMASLGVLAAGVGHEINNPLNFIRQGIDIISRKLGNSYRTEFKGIDEGIERISTIANSIRKFSRQVDKDEPCDIHEILSDCMVMLGSKLNDGVDMSTDFKDPNPIVMGNQGSLHQAFLNFLSNAIDATKKGDSIVISTINENESVCVIIADTGEGIPDDNLLKIRDPFFTTKELNKGTGLGLYLANEYISKHGGHFDIESQLGVGTKIKVSLPKGI